MKFGWLDVLILTAMCAAFAFAFAPVVSGLAYDYDESDYISAANRGLPANYTDKDAISVRQFVDMGLAALRKQIDRIALSEFIRKSNDIAMYRHYHGPTYFYYLATAKGVLPDSERAMRATTLALVPLTAIVAYLACFWLIDRNARLAAVISSAMILTSAAVIFTGAIITPHMAYALIALLTLVLLAKYVQTGALKYWWLTAAALALGFVTFEYAIMLLIATLVCLVLFRKRLFPAWPRRQLLGFSGKSLAIFLVTFVLAWPTGLFKLTLLRSYAFLTYVAQKREPMQQTLVELWIDRFTHSPLEWGLVLIAGLVAGYALLRGKLKAVWLAPFLIYAAIHLGSTLVNKSGSAKHVSAAIPMLALACGVLLAHWLAKRSRGVKIGVAVVLVAALYASPPLMAWWAAPQSKRLDVIAARVEYDGLRPRLTPRLRATRYVDPVIRYLEAHPPGGQRLLVHRQYQASINCYFPDVEQNWYMHTDGPEKIAERAAQDPFEALLYDGKQYARLRALLAERYQVDEVLLVENDGEKEAGQVVYARLTPRVTSVPATLPTPNGGG